MSVTSRTRAHSPSLISVTGRQSYPTTGALDMTTVEIFGGPGHRLSLLEVAQAWVSRTDAVVPERQVYPPGQTQQEVEKETAAEMTDSQEQATAAGLRELGLTVPETIRVAEVQSGVPAASVGSNEKRMSAAASLGANTR